MNTSPSRSQRTYDHRLRGLVRTVGDPDVVAQLGVLRLTTEEILTIKQMVESTASRAIVESVRRWDHPAQEISGLLGTAGVDSRPRVPCVSSTQTRKSGMSGEPAKNPL